MTSPELVVEGLVEAQSSLDQDQRWKLRPATVSVGGETSFVGQFDGEGFDGTALSDIPMISLVGFVSVGQRVMVMIVPPAGNYAISRLAADGISDWTDYTPELTAASVDPNLGDDGHIFGRWLQVGVRSIAVEIDILFSGAGVAAGTGQYFITTPFQVSARSIAAATGACYMFDSGTANRAGIVNVTSGGDNFFITNTPNGDVGAAVPQTWASGDAIRFTILLEIDSF